MGYINYNVGIESYRSAAMLPPDTDDYDDLPTRADIVAKYRKDVLAAIDAELDTEDKAATTEDDIEEWALYMALEDGEMWIEPNGEIRESAQAARKRREMEADDRFQDEH